MCPDYTTYQDERHGGHEHHTAVLVAEGVEALRDHLEPKQLTCAEQLAHEGYDDEDDGITQTVAQTVQQGIPCVVGHGERLEATHENTVSDDQTEVNAQLHCYVVSKGFEHLADKCHERRYHHELHDDTYTHRDSVTQKRHDHVRHRHDDRHGDSHDERRLELYRYGKRRTDTEHLHYDRVIGVKRTE